MPNADVFTFAFVFTLDISSLREKDFLFRAQHRFTKQS